MSFSHTASFFFLPPAFAFAALDGLRSALFGAGLRSFVATSRSPASPVAVAVAVAAAVAAAALVSEYTVGAAKVGVVETV